MCERCRQGVGASRRGSWARRTRPCGSGCRPAPRGWPVVVDEPQLETGWAELPDSDPLRMGDGVRGGRAACLTPGCVSLVRWLAACRERAHCE